MNKHIVVAVFIKDDMIQKQIDNILQLENLDEYNIIFVQDNTKYSPKYYSEYYKKKYENVSNIIKSNLSKFKNAELYKLDNNYHPYGTCQRGIDYGLVRAIFVFLWKMMFF